MKMCNFSLLIAVSIGLVAGSTHAADTIEQQKIDSSLIGERVLAMEAKGLLDLIPYQTGSELVYPEPVADSVNGAVNLQQGWTLASQQEFYYTTQGSQILPYKWYLHLEQSDSVALFRSDANIQQYGYIASEASELNPDGLSVGFAKDVGSDGKAWVGLTCAACHTTEVTYQDLRMRIDGGPTMADFQTFNVDLVAALTATLADPEKFSRFADNMLLDKNTSSSEQAALKQALQEQIVVLSNRNMINVPNDQQVPYGYGRLDAIGAIFNQVLSVFTAEPTNARPANAPVSYPFIWGTHQSDYVQWTGFAPNGPLSIGALIRNGGEVLGVYGKIDINSQSHGLGYSSSIDFNGLGLLEARVAQLRSPQWPSEAKLAAFQIDTDKSQAGKALYDKECASCHTTVARADEGQNYQAVLTPLSEIQTDSQEILNLVALRNADNYQGRKEAIVAGPTIGYTTLGLNPLVNSVVGSAIDQLEDAARAAFVQYMGGKLAANENNGINVSDKDKALQQAEVVAEFAALKDAYGELIKVYKRCEAYRAGSTKCSQALELTIKLVKGKALAKDIDSQITQFFESQKPSPVNEEVLTGQVYKARPLNGIWATAPYLHNGSVLSLMELLTPPKERLKTFYVGSRELDPVNVGFVNEQTEHSSLFDTSLLGNNNQGHVYGTQLSVQEKQTLVEYMKTL
ncbi:di-heme-cytochrome C peroxidase [Vibrio cionasavignyae]|uniref:di-heme-cytochrome C peroxidase n=1 Tax=Vibrio cionasavignyae TaxID=2910252 RepID=UPI003D0DB58D